MLRRASFPLLAGVLLAGCGGAAPYSAAPGASPTTSAPRPTTAPPVQATQAPPVQATQAAPTAAAGAPAVPAPAGADAVRFQVVSDQSKATFRVREQLVGVQLPSDAVGTTNAVTGQLVLSPDGAVTRDVSKITVDLRQLKTDDPRRDNFIKSNTLATGRFPMAEFVPAQAAGLPSPLPAAGEHTFTLTGPMTIRGVQKELTWDVKARREGTQLSGTATTSFKFGDFGMSPPRVPLVLSIVDDIRLEVELVATQAA